MRHTHGEGGKSQSAANQLEQEREEDLVKRKGRAGGLSELVVKGGGVHTLAHHHIIPTHQAPFGDLFIRLV